MTKVRTDALGPVPRRWYHRVLRPRWIVPAVAVALVGGGAWTLEAMTVQPSMQTVQLPRSLGGLPYVPPDQKLSDLFEQYRMRAHTSFGINQVKMAAYGPAGSTRFDDAHLLGVGLTALSPDAQFDVEHALTAYSPLGTASELFDGSAPTFRYFDAGPRGGKVACTVVHPAQVEHMVCAWADRTTVGYLTDLTGKYPMEQLATSTLELREKAERPA